MQWLVLAGVSAVLLPCLLFILLPILKRVRDIRVVSRAVRNIPCPVEKFHWISGSLAYIPKPSEESLKVLVEFAEKYPYCYKIWFGSLNPIIDVCHPDTVRQLCKSGAPKSVKSGWLYYFAKPWIGDGLLLSGGKKWFRNRRLLTPGFHFDILRPYMKIFNQCTENMMNNLSENRRRNGNSVDIYQKVSLCTLSIILKCAFSYDKEIELSDDKSQSPYVEAVMDMTHRIVQRLYTPLHHPDFIYYKTGEGRKFMKAVELSHQVAREVITQRRRTLDELGEEQMKASKKYTDFLDILLLAKDEDGRGLTDQEIQDEVETFMFEGHDTTKSAISFILYNLARHPHIYQAAQAEVDALLQGRESDEILWEDLSRMPYLTKCIKESMRLHPPVPAIGRCLDKPFTIDGRLLPSNTVFTIMIWSVHHNPLVWGHDHMTYDPERFAEENIAQMDPYAFIPFSAGSRNCIGQNFAMNELKVTVARCLKRFDVSVDPKVKVELLPEAILKAKDGIFLNFEPRL